MNHAETTNFLEEMQGCFPRISVRDVTIETWKEILDNVPYDTCHKAYIKYLKSGESREPKPGDILSIARTLHKPITVERQDCELCGGRGLLFILEQDGHECVARCSCSNGNLYPHFPVFKSDFYRKNELGRIEVA
ncbi:replicative helicase loader/inhibitor [Acetobacterium woodii]|uniref:replicative helicase loader/inhibitor n=1 Tax=Acetobacterium woodii TaxID=33952 RepID=UPI00145CAB10|nr:replicative helicase loader/inhibitor [Acetobacterium woodii]